MIAGLSSAAWGSTLALAYAVEHPSRVSELVLWGVTTTTRHEVDWLTWSMGEIYPEAFAELLALVPGLKPGGNLPAAYNRLLMSHDADLRDRAARSWCAWEATAARRRACTPTGSTAAPRRWRAGSAGWTPARPGRSCPSSRSMKAAATISSSASVEAENGVTAADLVFADVRGFTSCTTAASPNYARRRAVPPVCAPTGQQSQLPPAHIDAPSIPCPPGG